MGQGGVAPGVIGSDGGAQGAVFVGGGLVGGQGQRLRHGPRRAGWDGGQGEGMGGGSQPGHCMARVIPKGRLVIERQVIGAGGWGQPVGVDAGMMGGGRS